MTKGQLVEKISTLIENYCKDKNPDDYYFVADVCNLLRQADPDRYNQIFNQND